MWVTRNRFTVSRCSRQRCWSQLGFSAIRCWESPGCKISSVKGGGRSRTGQRAKSNCRAGLSRPPPTGTGMELCGSADPSHLHTGCRLPRKGVILGEVNHTQRADSRKLSAGCTATAEQYASWKGVCVVHLSLPEYLVITEKSCAFTEWRRSADTTWNDQSEQSPKCQSVTHYYFCGMLAKHALWLESLGNITQT